MRTSALVLAAAFTSHVLAQAPVQTEIPLPPGATRITSLVLSDDGRVVYGTAIMTATNLPRAFRWTMEGGIQMIRMPEGHTETLATRAVSGDGRFTFISCRVADLTLVWYPFRYDAADGSMTLVATRTVTLEDCTPDASYAIGTDRRNSGSWFAYDWSAGEGMTSRGAHEVFLNVSDDGETILGLHATGGVTPYYLRSRSGDLTALRSLPGLQVYDATCLSGDGRTAFGACYLPPTGPTIGCVWSAAGEPSPIEGPTGVSCEISDVSLDGSIGIAGMWNGSTSELGYWSRAHGRVRPLAEVVTELGGEVRLDLARARDISADGSTVLGWTLGVSGSIGRPWILTGLPAVCPADFNADGFLDFFDYSDFVTAFEAGDPRTDFNNDSFLDFFDYADFVSAFESGC